MSTNSKIQWTDATWNCVLGCDKVSQGCAHCYAILQCWMKQHHPNPELRSKFAGLVEKRADGSLNWTGKVRELPERLGIPISVKTPKMWFVNSMSDLFHEDVSDEFIEQVFAAMATAYWHTFQVLTKRPQRMLQWFSERYQVPLTDGTVGWESRSNRVWSYRGDTLDPKKSAGWTADGEVAAPWSWPLSNVWLGVSTEDQKTADERIPYLLKCPATVRFLSCEPLLGSIQLGVGNDFYDYGVGRDDHNEPQIHWVIAGGESGKGARPMHPDWARSLRDQCQQAGVAFHFKQWGEYGVGGENNFTRDDGSRWTWVDGYAMERRGNHANGRLLDGRTWDEFPVTHSV